MSIKDITDWVIALFVVTLLATTLSTCQVNIARAENTCVQCHTDLKELPTDWIDIRLDNRIATEEDEESAIGIGLTFDGRLGIAIGGGPLIITPSGPALGFGF